MSLLRLFIAFGVTMALVNWMTPPRSEHKSYKGDRLQVRVHHWHYGACNWPDGQRCQVI
jgi:hypothetical protein